MATSCAGFGAVLVPFDVSAQKRGKLCEMGMYPGRTDAADMPHHYVDAVTKFGGIGWRGCVSREKVVAAMGVFGAVSDA